MPEGGNKRNKRQAGLSDEAAERSSTKSPKWKIKSSCVWLIPGDVPGQRSRPANPPGPRALMVFRPTHFEPVKKSTYQATQSANGADSNTAGLTKADLAKADSSSSDLISTDLNNSNSSRLNFNSSGSFQSESAKGLDNETIATAASSSENNKAGDSHTSKQEHNRVIKFNHEADNPTDTITGLSDAQAAGQEVESDKANRVKPDVLSVEQSGPANYTYDKRPLSEPATSNIPAQLYDPVNDSEKFNYRKIISALLLLLLLLWLASLGKDYFENESKPAALAVSRVETTSIVQAGSVEAVPISVPEEKPAYIEEPAQLPAVNISLSNIGRRSIGGLRMLTHTVVRGDTLWDISKAYLKNPFRYPELAKLSHIKNPDLIYPGETIHIHIKISE